MSTVRVLILRSRHTLSPVTRWTPTSVTEMPGSCYMRSEQLRDVIGPHLPAGIEVTTRGISRRRMPSNALLQWIAQHDIVIMTKRVGYSQSRATIEAIRGTGARLGIDHVDGKLDDLRAVDAFDFHISASVAGTKVLSGVAENRPVFHLPHHPDPRIRPCEPMNSVEAVYFGSTAHLFVPSKIAREVTVLHAAHQRDADRSVQKLSAFNLHYAVRPDHETTRSGQFRPFTKGFNAAAAGANVIAQRGAVDAMHYLGDDYPYLVGAASDEEVTETFQRAKQSFGSAEWVRGLDTMRRVRDEISGPKIAEQFAHMINAIA